MKRIGCIVIALLAIVIVIGCTATIVQRNNTRTAVGQTPDAVQNIKTSAEDISESIDNAVDKVEEELEDSPVGEFFANLDNQ